MRLYFNIIEYSKSRFAGKTDIKKMLKERMITQVFLMTDRDKPAYEFYKKIGFNELPEITSFIMEF